MSSKVHNKISWNFLEISAKFGFKIAETGHEDFSGTRILWGSRHTSKFLEFQVLFSSYGPIFVPIKQYSNQRLVKRTSRSPQHESLTFYIYFQSPCPLKRIEINNNLIQILIKILISNNIIQNLFYRLISSNQMGQSILNQSL